VTIVEKTAGHPRTVDNPRVSMGAVIYTLRGARLMDEKRARLQNQTRREYMWNTSKYRKKRHGRPIKIVRGILRSVPTESGCRSHNNRVRVLVERERVSRVRVERLRFFFFFARHRHAFRIRSLRIMCRIAKIIFKSRLAYSLQMSNTKRTGQTFLISFVFFFSSVIGIGFFIV